MIKFILHQMRSRLGLFPNSELAVFVARSMLQRGLQVSLNKMIDVTVISVQTENYQTYWNDARGSKAMVDVLFLISFSSSGSSTSRTAFASLSVACETTEYIWAPNHCGSFVCVDGNKFRHLDVDHVSGNISVREEGHGCHISEEFRERVSHVPWEVFTKFGQV